MNKSGSSMRRMPWRRSVAASVALAISAAAFADTGGLRITINGPDGMPVPGATVKVSSPDSLVSKTGVTAADGIVRLQGLDPATNYTVEVSSSTYSPLSADNVAVVSGSNLSLTYSLGIQELEEAIVTGRSLAALDTTSATVATTITLDLTESLPTQRSFQSYLQLVPGVKPSETGNPSSKSGVNFSDGLGQFGQSSDNLYYIDGVNVTDPYTGTFGANLNSEIIQEQQVLTGGIPAEYEGGAGLVSKVVTKSGGDEFHGSINYYLQNDKLVEKNKHQPGNDFKTYDAAVTLGGPIIKEKLWFFGSYQKINRKTDVADALTGAFMRSVERDADQFFGKVTWQATAADRLQFTFFNDPTTISGSTTSATVNNRDRAQDQGGDNYKVEYSHDFGTVRVDAYGFKHKSELSNIAAEEATRNDMAYLTGSPTNADLQLGGYGQNQIQWRNRDEIGVKLESLLSSSWGEHTIKAGFAATTNRSKLDLTYTGGENAQYTSVAAQDAGLTFGQYGGGGMIGVTDITVDEGELLIVPAIDAAPAADRAYFYGLLDANSDGTISAAEFNALQFNSTAGNPDGQLNVYRIVMSETAPVTFKTKGMSAYLQDSWTSGKWTVNAGVRGEQWRHYATDGSKTFTFDWTVAPRLSVVYDVDGDGTSKLWAFGGRYYDPIRHDMTSFAGTLTGPVRDEQVFIGDRWLTYRTRGGSQVQDAFFAPATKTPYTDEFVLGYAKTLASNLTASIAYTKRYTRHTLEDYDLHLYSDGGTLQAAGSNLYIPISYFGYDSIPDSNYVIATLKGGKREYNGIEVSLRKLKSDHWQGMMSYTYNDMKANTMSDGNADYQGDVVWLDPRAPNVWGKAPGNITHQFKAAGSYFFNNGLEIGAVWNWNSGLSYSKTFDASGRHLPNRVATAYEFANVSSRWVEGGAIGGFEAPSVGTLDLQLKYTLDLPFGQMETFAQVFNALNDQGAYLVQDLAAGDGAYAFGEGNAWTSPRRYYLGVRFSF